MSFLFAASAPRTLFHNLQKSISFVRSSHSLATFSTLGNFVNAIQLPASVSLRLLLQVRVIGPSAELGFGLFDDECWELIVREVYLFQIKILFLLFYLILILN